VDFQPFTPHDLSHLPTKVLRLLADNEISFRKACEWLNHYYADGRIDPLPLGPYTLPRTLYHTVATVRTSECHLASDEVPKNVRS
jgi:hypothetical protein